MRIERVSFDHPDAQALTARVQLEYVERYGSPDQTPVDASEFVPPLGVFLVGYLDGSPVATGGWRAHGPDAELKRMYVVPEARGRGFARTILGELERSALHAGRHRLILETGQAQPEAIALYRSEGYTGIERFGIYACSPSSLYLGKHLRPAGCGETDGGYETRDACEHA